MPQRFNHSREIFSSPGVPEDPNVTREREEARAERLRTKEGGPNTAEWKEFLERVNFPLLKKIFVDVAARCGVPESAINFVGPDRIFSSYGFNESSAKYDPAGNLIIVSNPEELPFFVDGTEEEKETMRMKLKRRLEAQYGSLDINRLVMLAHEEGHAVSRSVCVDWQEGKREWRYSHVGYVRTFPYEEYRKGEPGMKTIYKKEPILFNAVNEGVNEKFIREVALAYLEQSNWPQEEIERFKNTLRNDPDQLSYSMEVSIIDGLIRKLANKTDQSERVVWESLVAGQIQGETFEEDEITELFKESFGRNFLPDLAKFGQGDSEEERRSFKLRYRLGTPKKES